MHLARIFRSRFKYNQTKSLSFIFFSARNVSFRFLYFQFEKPGRRENFDYPQMVKESVTKALADAKINYKDIQQACVGFVSGNQ